ncbi:MAG: asparaginase [Pseudomonadota bacterium]
MSEPNPGQSVPLVEIWRGEILESVHRGTAAICTPTGALVEAWGDPARVILPRSACKMIQALPLVESGAAGAQGLAPEHLALATASHHGAPDHVGRVRAWLSGLGLGDDALLCGAHPPNDKRARAALRQAGETPGQVHNNCSGKHAGFLSVVRHTGAGPDYVAADHPVQRAVLEATEACAGETAGGNAIDGCSAPNFALSVAGFATALARFARPEAAFSGTRAAAAAALTAAMAAHPLLVAGEDSGTTALIRAASGGAVAKSGAEGVYAAILPEPGLGIAVKIDDGAKRASEAAIAGLMARHGALDRGHPTYRAIADAPLVNWRGIAHGHLRLAAPLRA